MNADNVTCPAVKIAFGNQTGGSRLAMKKKAKTYDSATITIPEKAMFLYGEEPTGWTPQKVSEWIDEHDNGQSLADMLSQVHNHVGMLMHALEEDKCDKGALDSWDSVEERLIEMVLERISDVAPEIDGTFNKVKPFMEQHGYVDGGGWWVPKNEDGRPASVYVPVSDIEERKRHLLGLLSELTVASHTSSDDGYEDLEDGYTEYTIGEQESPSPSGVWLQLPDGYGEITFGVGEWHGHYDWYEHDLQCLEWEIGQIVSGSLKVMSLYAGDSLIGTTLFRGDPRGRSYWQMLNRFHLDPAQKRMLKENGARFSFVSPASGKQFEFAYSEFFAAS